MADFFPSGGYPANYFGKGKEFILPDDQEILQEFGKRFEEYELAHPEDPLGELAMAKEESATPARQTKLGAKEFTAEPPTEEKGASGDEEWAEIEMVLPARHIDLFKRYCRFQRRRPRDVFMLWIDRFCKL